MSGVTLNDVIKRYGETQVREDVRDETESGPMAFSGTRRLQPVDCESFVLRFCSRSEWQQSGLRLQHSNRSVDDGFGPMTVLAELLTNV